MVTARPPRRQYVSRVADPIVSRYWQASFPEQKGTRQAEHVSSTLNKIGRFLTNPVIRNIVAQSRSTFDFRTVMDEGKVVLVNLSKGQLGEDNSSLLGSVLVGKILIAAMSRSDISAEKRRPFHLIVDEYHSFATESFPTLQSEARKFAIDTVVAHQYRDQLDILNRGSTLNVGNFILFRITGRDAREMAMQFDNSPPQAEDVLKSVPYRTGRDGVYRTAGDQVKVKGSRRSYGDVSNETANYLTNVPNYRAYCKLIEGAVLAEYFIDAQKCELPVDEAVRGAIKERSQAMAPKREDVEAFIAKRFGASAGTNGSRPAGAGVTYD